MSDSSPGEKPFSFSGKPDTASDRLTRNQLPNAAALRSSTDPGTPSANSANRDDYYGPEPIDRTLIVSSPEGRSLAVEIHNRDLRFIDHPLILGHYRSSRLSGTEALADTLIGGMMAQALAAHLYPAEPGSVQIFANRQRDQDNPWQLPRPRLLVVAGLGDEGRLKPEDLAMSARQAILAYAQHLVEQSDATNLPSFELAAVLLGSGGPGISAGRSAQMLVRGALDANRRLKAVHWPSLTRLHLVERYLDRASEAWHALRVLNETRNGKEFELGAEVSIATGAMRYRVESGYRGAEYDLISVVRGPMLANQPTIEYTVDSRRARTELRGQKTQGPLVSQLVRRGSNDREGDTRIGRTLFNLLIPYELGPALGGSTATVLELDQHTAPIPWELLETDEGNRINDEPWAIRTKLLRKLRTEGFREMVSHAGMDDGVLIVGQPVTSVRYGDLPGAASEAAAVAKRFRDRIDVEAVHELINPRPDAYSVINALYEHPYRVLHIAGHGSEGAHGGVVLSGDVVLGASEVQAMRRVPELVFLNCCHLAGRDAKMTEIARDLDRAEFAANVADQLIKIGVRCVVAAGWAVEDEPATQFADVFYKSLLDGLPFIDAVQAARRAAREAAPSGNTWAAYQCYGDPEWRWQQALPTVSTVNGDLPKGETIASWFGLAILLENIATEADLSQQGREEASRRVPALERHYAGRWGHIGTVAEAFGLAYSNAGDRSKAIEWYDKAITAADGTATFRAAEQRHNLSARQAENLSDPNARGAQIDLALAGLGRLYEVSPTSERASLLGSAYKRKAMLLGAGAAAMDDQLAALRSMGRYYAEAYGMKSNAGESDQFYPLMNSLSGEIRWALLDPAKDPGTALPTSDPRWALALDALKKAEKSRPDFWCYVGRNELRMLEGLRDGQLAKVEQYVLKEFRKLRDRVASRSRWDSVHNNARSVLEPYMTRCPGEEATSAQRILSVLASFALQDPPSDAPSPASS